MLGLVLIHPAAQVLLIPLALVSLLLLLWPDRGEASPLRRWWLRSLLTGIDAAGLAIETSNLSLAIYGAPAMFFGPLVGFAAIAALLLLAGLAGGLLTLIRRGARQPAPAGRSPER
jgi:hypothetical protein